MFCIFIKTIIDWHKYDCSQKSRILLEKEKSESAQLSTLLDSLQSVVASNQKDRWVWLLDDSGSFRVVSTKNYIDSRLLVVDSICTRWNRLVPIKVNVFVWRLGLNKIATRDNLDKRGIDVSSLICPFMWFGFGVRRSFVFLALLAMEIWSQIGRWWQLNILVFSYSHYVLVYLVVMECDHLWQVQAEEGGYLRQDCDSNLFLGL